MTFIHKKETTFLQKSVKKSKNGFFKKKEFFF